MALEPIAFAADNHNIASGSDSFVDYAKFTAGAAAGAVAGQALIPIPIAGAVIGAVAGGLIAQSPSGAAKYAVGSVVSGAHSFYNTGVDLGNWMSGGNIERADTERTLQNMDSSLGEYYSENAQSVDIGGLILGGIIPGVGATKLVNKGSQMLAAARAGKFGLNISSATGIAPTLSEALYSKAAYQLANGTVVSQINKASVLGLAAGLGEQSLMVAGTELLVATTMEANPIVEKLTWKEHIHNAAVGAAFFAPIFAGFGALKGKTAMTASSSAADIEANKYTYIPKIDDKMTDDQALFLFYGAKKTIPSVPSGLHPDRERLLARHVTETTSRLDDEILGRWQKITGGDIELSKALMELGEKSTVDKILWAVAYLKEVKRGNQILRADAGISRDITALIKNSSPSTVYATAEGKLYLDEASAVFNTPLDSSARITSQEFFGLKILDNSAKGTSAAQKKLSDADILASGYHAVVETESKELRLLATSQDLTAMSKEALLSSASSEYSKGFLHLRGELKGTISSDMPAVLRLGDYLKPGESINVVKGAVYVGREQYKQLPVGSAVDLLGAPLPAVQSRYVFAARHPHLKEGIAIHETDIPFLEKAYSQRLANFKIVDSAGNVTAAPTADDLLSFIERQKVTLANQSKATTSLEVSERLNVPVEYLEGRTVSPAPERNLLMYQTELADAARGRVPYAEPSYAQLGYRTADFDMVGNKLDHLVSVEQRVAMAEQYNNQVFANYTKELFESFPNITREDIALTTRFSGGQTFASFGQGEYFTPEMKAEFASRLTATLVNKSVAVVDDVLNPTALKLANDSPAAIEASVILNRARSISDSYVLSVAGDKLTLKIKLLFDAATDGMVTKAAAKAEKDAAATPAAKSAIQAELQKTIQGIRSSRVFAAPATKAGVPIDVEIAINNPSASAFLRQHIEENARRVAYSNTIRAARGQRQLNLIEGELYAPPPDFKRYPHYALVRDPVTEEMSYIGAYTGEDLKKLGAQVPKHLEVLYKENTDFFHKNLGDYSFLERMSDTSVDVTLKREGILNYYFPKTDGVEIVTDVLTWHKEQAANLARDMVRLKYSEAIGMLDTLSAQYTAAGKSVVRTSEKTVTESVRDPYSDMIKTMLNVSKVADYRVWNRVSNSVDSYVSRAFGNVTQLMERAKSADELLAINDSLAKSGYRGPIYGADTVLAANHSAPQGVLSEFVRKSNALATNLMLKLDFIQAANNAIGTNVLLSGEMVYLIDKIKKHPAAAAKLKVLMETEVPGAAGISLSTPAKLQARQYSKFFTDLANPASPIITRYTDIGWLPDVSQALRDTVENLAIKRSITKTEITAQNGVFNALKGIGEKAIQKGELWTANKHSEMMGRFVAAGVADDITSIAVEAGILSAKDALVVINSFVNKVHGSTLASQRPILFQGVVGQAISLFQSYQFNLMQQLFKYVGDGQTKSAATLLGMQTAIYGVQGLPLFNAVNTHIIGTAAGNTSHQDIYTAAYDTAGKQGGDWLLYGAASNILGLNMYSRGDINPRQVTVVPVLPADIPVVAITSKFVGSMYGSLSQSIGGAPAGAAFLQGLEHAGINRPLSGLASFIQGYTTTGKGSLLSATRKEDISGGTDWMLLANMQRMAGAKPLDEAVLLDANYRYTAYKAKELDKMKALGKTVKTTMLSGRPLDSDTLTDFIQKYQAAGGKQERFAQQMIAWQKDSKESVVNQVASQLNTGAGKYLQRVMAGSTGMPDFTHTAAEE